MLLKLILRHRALRYATAVLALGIGVSTSVFSLAQAVLFHPLPFFNQDELSVVWKADSKNGVPFLELAYPELKDLQQGVPALQSVAVMPTTLYGYGQVLQIGKQTPVQLESAPVSSGYFATLGTPLLLGRDFSDQDEHPGAAPAVILSFETWRTYLQADPNVIGKRVTLNQQGYSIIGVARQNFDFPRGAQLWTPIGLGGGLDARADYYLQAIVRRKHGYSAAQLSAQIDSLFKRSARDYPQFYSATQGAVVTPMTGYWAGSAKTQLTISLAASFLLLLAGCVAASNLMLSHVVSRRAEIATRAALGASRAQIARHFLSLGVCTGMLAGLAGLLTACALIRLLVRIAPPDIPRLQDAVMNWQVLLFGFALSLFASAACSLAPALAAFRMNIESMLRDGASRISGSHQAARFQMGFTAAQTCASVVLLSCSLLVVISVREILHTDTGFSHKETLTMNLALHNADASQRRIFYSELLRRLKQSPSVSDAGAILVRPLEGSIGWDMTYEPEFDTGREQQQLPVSNFEVATPGYFATVGTPLLEGRDFNEHDSDASPKVVILSAGLAARFRREGHNPLGARIRFGRHHDGEWWTVVGVSGPTRYRGVTTRDEDIYVCYLQSPIPVNYLVVRGPADNQQLTSFVRQTVHTIDPTRAIANVATIGELEDRDSARQRFNMLLLLSFGLTSALLTAAGIYSIVAETVLLRHREIAIRLALGSSRGAVVRTFTLRTLLLVTLGEAAGLMIVVLAGRNLSPLLYGITPDNPFVLSFVLFLVASLAVTAASVPAWIASKQAPAHLFN